MKQIAETMAYKWKKPKGTVWGWVQAQLSLGIVRACSACIRGSKIPGGARARRVDPETMVDDSDGAFLGLQLTNGPAGQGRRVD